MLVPLGANLRYLSGFTGSNGMLLVDPRGTVLFTDPRYRLQSAVEATCKVKICSGPLLPQVVSTVRRRRIRRLGFEKGHTNYETYQYLREQLPLDSSLEPVSGWIERHRMVKSPDEVALVRASVLANSRAFEQAARHVRPGMCERDLAAEIEYRMRRLGAEKPAFDTIVAGGARSALVHARPTAARLAPGSLVIVDMGAMRDGYASDMTRMLYLGDPPARVKRIYRAVLQAQLAAVDAVRAGVPARRVDKAARDLLKTEKLDTAFIHSTGHGLGLEIHEPPRLGKKEKLRLAAGMTVTIEPGVYIEGFGGIRIEDTVVVGEHGCEVLTPTPKELLAV